MQHLDPRLAVAHRTLRPALFDDGIINLRRRLYWQQLAITTGPVRAAEAAIRQAHKGTEGDQIKRQKSGEGR